MPDGPFADPLFVTALILAVGWMVAVAVALHYRGEAIRWRGRSGYWRTRANAGRWAIKSAWCRKCGPPIDGATAGRIAAYLTGGDVPCR